MDLTQGLLGYFLALAQSVASLSTGDDDTNRCVSYSSVAEINTVLKGNLKRTEFNLVYSSRERGRESTKAGKACQQEGRAGS